MHPSADNLVIAPMDVVETSTHLLLKASGSFTVEESGNQITHVFRERRIPVRRSALRLPTVHAWVWTTLHTRHFTEYALPFLVALGPLAFAIWHRLTRV